MAASAREAVEYFRQNRESYPQFTDADIERMEADAVRGDILLAVGEKKTTFSEEARSAFADMISALAAEFEAGVKKTGTSGQHRIVAPTPYGKFTLVLDPSEV